MTHFHDTTRHCRKSLHSLRCVIHIKLHIHEGNVVFRYHHLQLMAVVGLALLECLVAMLFRSLHGH